MDEKKLKKLEDLNRMITEGLSREEFLKSFEAVVKQVLKMEKDLILKLDAKTKDEIDNIRNLQGEFRDIIIDAKEESNSSLASFKRKTVETINSLFIKSSINSKLNTIMESHSLKLEEIDLLKKRLENIKDGHTPTNEELLDIIEPLIPEKAKDVDEDVIIQKVLELIPENEDFRDEIKKLEDKIKAMPTGRVMTPRYVHVPMVDVFTGDGSNKAFTLTKAPKNLNTIDASSSDFPNIYANNAGFTMAGKVLTLDNDTDALSLNARMIVRYYV